MRHTLPDPVAIPRLQTRPRSEVAPFLEPLVTVDLVTADAIDECVCEADTGCGDLLIDHAYRVRSFGQRSKLVCSWACVSDVLMSEVSL